MATIAARRRSDDGDRGSIVASIWNEDGILKGTVLHQANGRFRANHFQIAASPISGWTAFHSGDDSVLWLDRTGATTSVPAKFKHGTYVDLSLDRAGAGVDGRGRRKARAAREPDPTREAQSVKAGWSTGTRCDLTCVRAANDFLVVGCENALSCASFTRMAVPSTNVRALNATRQRFSPTARTRCA